MQGRRRLLLLSLLGVVATMTLLATVFYVSEQHSPPVVPNIPDFSGVTCSVAADSCIACLQHGCLFCSESHVDASAGGVCIDSSAAGQCSPEKSGILGTGALLYDAGCPSRYSGALILGLMAYLAAFSVGLGHVPWVVNSEIYPTHLRGFASGLAGCANWVTNGIVSQTFLLLIHWLRPSGAFLVYAGMALLGLAWAGVCVPETKGLSLAQILDLFARRGTHSIEVATTASVSEQEEVDRLIGVES